MKAADICLYSLVTFTSPVLCSLKKISPNFSPCWVTTNRMRHDVVLTRHGFILHNVKPLVIHSLDRSLDVLYAFQSLCLGLCTLFSGFFSNFCLSQLLSFAESDFLPEKYIWSLFNNQIRCASFILYSNYTLFHILKFCFS